MDPGQVPGHIGKFTTTIKKCKEQIMSEFKVGDRVRTTSKISYPGGCDEGYIGTITALSAHIGISVWRYVLDEGAVYTDLDVFELVPRDLDNLTLDDVLLNDDGEEYTVISVHDKVIDLADDNGHHCAAYTAKELKDHDWTVKQPSDDDDTVEMTLEEVAKLKGVDVDKLRIKD
jgi:hypothetical protein